MVQKLAERLGQPVVIDNRSGTGGNVGYEFVAKAKMRMIGGEIDMTLIVVPTALPQTQAGKVRALAVLSNGRFPSLPNVPTAKEAGIDNWEVAVWYGVLAPAGTRRDYSPYCSSSILTASGPRMNATRNPGRFWWGSESNSTPRRLSSDVVAAKSRTLKPM